MSPRFFTQKHNLAYPPTPSILAAKSCRDHFPFFDRGTLPLWRTCGVHVACSCRFFASNMHERHVRHSPPPQSLFDRKSFTCPTLVSRGIFQMRDSDDGPRRRSIGYPVALVMTLSFPYFFSKAGGQGCRHVMGSTCSAHNETSISSS